MPRQDPRRTPRPDTVNERLLDRTIRHLLYLTRITTTEVNEILSKLRGEVYPELIDELLPAINRIRNMSDGGALTSSQVTALSATSAALNETIVSQMTRMREFLSDRLLEIGRTEAAFELGLFRNAIPIEVNFSVPSESQLRAIINNQPLDGVPISEWFDNMGADTNRRVMREIRQGMIEGEGIDDIVRRIRGRRSAGFSDGVLNTTTNDAERLVRTAVIDTSYKSRRAFFEANEEYIKGEKIIATLDSRTCSECMRREQESAERPLPLGEGARPPFHPNCRCTVVSVTKSWKELGIDLNEAPEGTRASMDGQVPASMTYDEWLRGQDDDVIEEALGKTRAKLFKEGNLSVTSFTDRQGRQFTLDELRQRESDAFRAAGLMDD